MSRLRIALIAQLLFFACWAGWLLYARSGGAEEFYLETTPVDPRDLLSGTYVALGYGISSPQAGACPRLLGAPAYIYVNLADSGRSAATERGPARIYEAADCSGEARYGPGWVRAAVQPGRGGRNAALYGIERFYLNENNPLKDARSGSVIARVKIDKGQQLVLLDLVKKL